MFSYQPLYRPLRVGTQHLVGVGTNSWPK